MDKIEPTVKTDPEPTASQELSKDHNEEPVTDRKILPNDPPEIRIRKMIVSLDFEEFGVHRRAALGLIPKVIDPELNAKMAFSRLKSDRSFQFIGRKDLSITMDGGYRLCRATRSIQGPFHHYWEFKFEDAASEESHIRVGISTLAAKFDRPVAYDENGYCVRDKGGAFHDSTHKDPVPSPEFHVGDVVSIGLLSTEHGVEFRMWLNGNDCGALYSNVDPNKAWYPAASVYRKAVISARFARPFAFDPGKDWLSAEDSAFGEPDGILTSSELVAMMKGSPLSGEPSVVFAAMDAALTPRHEMPI